MINDKSPGNDELTKFNKTIWDEIIDLFYKSVKDAITKKSFVTTDIEKAFYILDHNFLILVMK